VQLGQMDDAGWSAMGSEEAELREQLITKHYSRRIAELTSQLQLADSKALHFFAEVSLLLLDIYKMWCVQVADSVEIETDCLSLL